MTDRITDLPPWPAPLTDLSYREPYRTNRMLAHREQWMAAYRERMKLAAAKLREIASQCAVCAGTGNSSVDISDTRTDCAACAGYREVIRACEVGND